MWGGIKLHEFYPPLATITVRYLSMLGALILSIGLSFILWTIHGGPMLSILFIISYFTLVPLLYVGRFAEFLGYTIFLGAFLTDNAILSGLLLGLAGLCHPLPLIFGSILLFSKFQIIPYVVAFITCSWWYIPFFLKRRRLPFLKENRPDKVLGIYLSSWALMLNTALFLFLPTWVIIFSVLWWFVPVHISANFRLNLNRGSWRFTLGLLKRTPFFLPDLIKETPFSKTTENPIIVSQKGGYFSTGNWVWAIASYMLDRGIIVYNGLPATEVPLDNLNIPPEIPVHKIDKQ